MQRIRQRDQQALSALYDRYSSPVYSLALRVLGDSRRAEEITQDVFLRVWSQPDKWDSSRGRLISWMLTITRYAAIDLLRAEQRQPALSETPLEEDSPLADPDGWNAADWSRGQALRQALAQLPPEQRHLIELAFYGGLTHRELAERLALPFGTVKTRLRLGLQKLRQLWQQEPDV